MMADFEVVFGEVKDIELKFKNFKAFYQKALKDKKLDAYKKGKSIWNIKEQVLGKKLTDPSSLPKIPS